MKYNTQVNDNFVSLNKLEDVLKELFRISKKEPFTQEIGKLSGVVPISDKRLVKFNVFLNIEGF